MKTSDFGIQIPVCPPKINDENFMLEITNAVTSARLKALDDEILAEIVRIAKEADIAHLVVLDKENVVEALTKASAKKVRYIAAWAGDLEVCPSCDSTLSFTDMYCPRCGQKLERGSEE